MSKEVTPRQSKKPLTLRHAAAVTAVGVIGALIAFWVLSGIFSFFFFFVRVAVVVALMGGVFWLISRFRR